MKVLVVKTSSMGDVIHALPALQDATRALDTISFDWVVEAPFEDIVAAHPLVTRTIPVAIRQWRSNWFVARGAVGEFVSNLRRESYDLVIDSQGLIKSALIASLARGPVAGFDRHSAREWVASLFYGHSVPVARQLHAVARQRQLFADLLGYAVTGEPDYGLGNVSSSEPGSVMLLHGTTWRSKEWPEVYWFELAGRLVASGYQVLVPGGTREEQLRAQRISAQPGVTALPRTTLKNLMQTMASCDGVVSVDTGLGHLGAAFGKPMVALYGATDPALTGISGSRQKVIVSDNLPCIPCKKRVCRFAIDEDSSRIHPPCFQPVTPEHVWQALLSQIGQRTLPNTPAL